jgi:large subunit ribosomal protein L22
MEIVSKHRFARVSAQKARLVAALLKGKNVSSAADILKFTQKKTAFFISKLLSSALANAEHNFGLDIDALVVNNVIVEEGPVFKRFHARARGRGNRIEKRTSHITLILNDEHEVSN